MKNKGFTLIELLAVIVVLAIIALIATPRILNVVEKARKGAAVSSALGSVDAVEKQIMVNQLNENPEINDGEYELPMDSTYKISVKGSKPSSGSLTITKSKVVSASMCINNYTVTYDGKKATATGKCDSAQTSDNESNEDTVDDSTYVMYQVAPGSHLIGTGTIDYFAQYSISKYYYGTDDEPLSEPIEGTFTQIIEQLDNELSNGGYTNQIKYSDDYTTLISNNSKDDILYKYNLDKETDKINSIELCLYDTEYTTNQGDHLICLNPNDNLTDTESKITNYFTSC